MSNRPHRHLYHRRKCHDLRSNYEQRQQEHQQEQQLHGDRRGTQNSSSANICDPTRIPTKMGDFVEISGLLDAGISAEVEPQLFYRRDDFQSLSEFVDKIASGCHIGLVDGLPGTGKSSTLWWKLRQLVTGNKSSLLWIHMDRAGIVSDVVKVDSATLMRVELQQQVGWDDFWKKELSEISAPSTGIATLVFDGVNHKRYVDARVALLNFVKTDKSRRCGFITMSNKIKREHKHQLDIWEMQQKKGMNAVAHYYHTQHSWTLKEYLGAYVDPNTGAATKLFIDSLPVFEKDWNNIDVRGKYHTSSKRNVDGSKKFISVEEAVTQKFAFAGGSVRWMASETTQSISDMISTYTKECIRLDTLLTFALGEESPYAKTHLYFSTKDNRGLPQYSLVSQHATLLAVKNLGVAGTKSLYRHAIRLDNPAFTGWVIEADIIRRCAIGPLELEDMGGSLVQLTSRAQDPIEFDHDALVAGASTVNDLKIPSQGMTSVYKPTKWNQGGYDVMFVTAGGSSGKGLALRFGQVTKSTTHSLKLTYFAEVVCFLSAAGYVIDSVEIAFIVTKQNISNFRVLPSKVSGSGLLSHANVPPEIGHSKWNKGKEQDLVSVYGVDLTLMGYH